MLGERAAHQLKAERALADMLFDACEPLGPHAAGDEGQHLVLRQAHHPFVAVPLRHGDLSRCPGARDQLAFTPIASNAIGILPGRGGET